MNDVALFLAFVSKYLPSKIKVIIAAALSKYVFLEVSGKN
ncbi:hypothetical protein HG1285_13022 [Hydrogenivirga sp. 128-5-R1-1]|nr:hypothetical protein HG1285_13022 [Hydrogenivirga sp. 128-5-R1-1]